MRTRTRRLSAALAAVALAASLSYAQPTEEPAVRRIRLPGRNQARILERALEGARRRLESPKCQRLYTDFADPSGRPLLEALDRSGLSGRAYLDTLIFYDGSFQPRCQSKTTLAFTWRSSQVVFVCARQFQDAAFHDPVLAEAALIHESLHSLGLGENPPSSAAITSAVIARCSL